MREAHEALTAEDRSLERAFRRDFADVPEFLDVLVTLTLILTPNPNLNPNPDPNPNPNP